MKDKKDKGFTLIELLAVIVILAIIALIAVPIVLNIIGSAKEKSEDLSKERYLKAVEQAIILENINGPFNERECEIEYDGNLKCGEKKLLIVVNGIKPCSGTITFDEGGKILKETLNYCNGENNSTVEKSTLVDGPTFNSIISGLEIKPKIIEFLSNGRVPDGISKDELLSLEKIEGLSEDGSIIGYVKDVTEGENTTRTLYIYSDNLISFNKDSSSMFNTLPVREIKFNEVNTSEVTNMSKMFYWHTNLVSLDLSSFDTHNVTDMSYMFYGLWFFISCNKLESINFGENFDTSKVIDMSYMFGYDTMLTNLDLSKFNTNNVTNMSYMFYHCEKLTSLDLDTFDTSKVTDMSYMFYDCGELTSLSLSSFDTHNVTNMSHMFSSSSNLTTLDLTNFDISNVENIGYIFSSTPALTQVLVSKDKWVYKDGIDTTTMFDSSNISSVTYKN